MTTKKKLSAVAAALIIIGLAGSLLTYKFGNEWQEIAEEKTIPGSQVAAIDIRTDNTRVELLPSDDQDINIQLNGKAMSNDVQQLSVNVADSTLSISVDKDWDKWFNFNIGDHTLTLTISLPEKQYQTLKIANNNGYITGKQLDVASIAASTDNGRIELSHISSQDVQVEADNGKITLDHVTGVLEGKTKNGSVTVLTKELNQNITLETNNGRILIQTETDPANVTFLTHVDNGRVNILGQYNDSSVIGDGKTLVKLSADNGSITVKKQ